MDLQKLQRRIEEMQERLWMWLLGVVASLAFGGVFGLGTLAMMMAALQDRRLDGGFVLSLGSAGITIIFGLSFVACTAGFIRQSRLLLHMQKRQRMIQEREELLEEIDHAQREIEGDTLGRLRSSRISQATPFKH